MSRGRFLILFTIAALAALLCRHTPAAEDSCSTFVMARDGTLLVGHNLDENTKVPGLLVANPRGIAKENVTYDDLKAGGRTSSAKRIRWVSRFGSVTYNVFGREFPDGGINEAGLYVGEMTLMQTEWPGESPAARMYHHQWIQYLLDNFATVDEAVASLSSAFPEGHCRWHFLLADKNGGAAVVEFLKGNAVVYKGKTLPHRILCNDAYAAELRDLKPYEGFGGNRNPEPRYEREDPRFRWAAVMLRRDDGKTPAPDYAFAILDRLNLGNRKWALVCDLLNSRVYLRTSVAPRVRWVDVSAFDFACARGPQALDINRSLQGDVQKQFAPLTDSWNREAVGNAWAELDAGTLGNLFFKPRMVAGLRGATGNFACQTR